MKQMRVALAQLPVVDGDKKKNLERIEKSIEQAYGQSADLLVFPELILTGFVQAEQLVKLAESREGESLTRIKEKISKYPIHLVYSFLEFVAEDEIYITTCFLHKNGTPLQYYRKTHLFADESLILHKGNKWTELNLGGFKIGLLTCYDIEFPETARTLALKGVNLLIVNSANMSPYEHRHRIFIIARALENHCFVAYCNRIGSSSLYEYHGQSAVIGPDGKVLMEIEDDMEMVKVTDISLEQVEQSKSIFNYIVERRSELYEGCSSMENGCFSKREKREK